LSLFYFLINTIKGRYIMDFTGGLTFTGGLSVTPQPPTYGAYAIFGYGEQSGRLSMTNLVSNIGVVSTDVTGVGTARSYLAAAGYGSDKAIFGYGYNAGVKSMTNLVSNTGVVSTDTTGVGTSRYALTATSYGQ
jgi:hypothetical protein